MIYGFNKYTICPNSTITNLQGGTSVEWVSAEYALKQGMKLKKEAYNPDTARFFKQ